MLDIIICFDLIFDILIKLIIVKYVKKNIFSKQTVHDFLLFFIGVKQSLYVQLKKKHRFVYQHGKTPN